LANLDFAGVKTGEYSGTANYKFKLVDAEGPQLELNDPSIMDNKLFIGSGQSHDAPAVLLDGVDVSESVTWESSDSTIAKVSDDGIVTTSAKAKAGDSVEIVGTYMDTNQTASILDALGVITAHAAEKKTVSYTVSIVEINFDDTLSAALDSINLFPGESIKIRALIEPETNGTVSWSVTRSSGVGLKKEGNYCTIRLAEDMPEGNTFELLATYGDYSKKLPVNVKSHHTHIEGTPVRENVIEATCTSEGSYDEVIYCPEDGTEISREQKTIAKKAHEPKFGTYGKCKNCNNTLYAVDLHSDYTIEYDNEEDQSRIVYLDDTKKYARIFYTPSDEFTLPESIGDSKVFNGWKGSNGIVLKEISLNTPDYSSYSFTSQYRNYELNESDIKPIEITDIKTQRREKRIVDDTLVYVSNVLNPIKGMRKPKYTTDVLYSIDYKTTVGGKTYEQHLGYDNLSKTAHRIYVSDRQYEAGEGITRIDGVEYPNTTDLTKSSTFMLPIDLIPSYAEEVTIKLAPIYWSSSDNKYYAYTNVLTEKTFKNPAFSLKTMELLDKQGLRIIKNKFEKDTYVIDASNVSPNSTVKIDVSKVLTKSPYTVTKKGTYKYTGGTISELYLPDSFLSTSEIWSRQVYINDNSVGSF